MSRNSTPGQLTRPGSIPGLVNLGNTCYLNASLQAMASSEHFTSFLAQLADAFETTAPPEASDGVSLAQQVQAALKAAARFLWEGPIDESAPSTAQLTAEAAQGHLTRSLHAVLSALQPHQPCCDAASQQQQQQQCLAQRRPRVAAVHPGEVLSRLAWFVPEGVLEPGLQQDAAEALELLCDALATELTCWHKLHGISWQQRQGHPAGLQALLPQHHHHHQQQQQQQDMTPASCPPDQNQQHQLGTDQQPQQQQQSQPNADQQPQQQPQQLAQQHCDSRCEPLQGFQAAAAAGLQSGDRNVRLGRGQEAAAGCQQQWCLVQQAGAAGGLPWQLPVVGQCLDEITCLECGDRYPCSTTPFTVLPLPLPCSPQQLSVPCGTRLTDCLARYSQAEVLQGVECLRCSLRASLQQAEQENCPAGLQQHHAQLSTGGVDVQDLAAAGSSAMQSPGLSNSRESGCSCAEQEDAVAEQHNKLSQQTDSCPCDIRDNTAGSLPALSTHAAQSQHHQQELASLLLSLCASQQPLPPLDYQQLLQGELHLPWLPQHRPVLKRTLLGRPPAVLLLQLQRSAHVAGLGAKIQGFVQFPLQLEWPALQQHQEDSQQTTSCALQQGQQQCQDPLCKSELGQQVPGHVLYDLVAVVQHLGSSHGSGHYIMYRRLQAGGSWAVSRGHDVHHQQQEQQPGQHSFSHSWLCVSDTCAQPVSEQEVLRCHATLLVYDRQQQAGYDRQQGPGSARTAAVAGYVCS